MDTPEYPKYKAYILKWHYFLNEVEELLKESGDEAWNKQCCMLILQAFYMKKYDGCGDFYEQFEERYQVVKEALS